MNFKEYMVTDASIDEASISLDKILKKVGGKEWKMADEPVNVKNKLFGSMCLALGPQLEKGNTTLKKEQIDKIIELLQSIKKDTQ